MSYEEMGRGEPRPFYWACPWFLRWGGAGSGGGCGGFRSKAPAHRARYSRALGCFWVHMGPLG